MDLEAATKDMVVGTGYAPFANPIGAVNQPDMSLSDAIHSLQPYEKILQIIEDTPDAVNHKGEREFEYLKYRQQNTAYLSSGYS